MIPLGWRILCGVFSFNTEYRGVKYPAPCVYCINHPTSLDPLYVHRFLGYPRVMATRFIFGLPIVGAWFRAMDWIEVGINGEKSPLDPINEAKLALASGASVLIAPEGKMSDDVRGPAKTGAIRISRGMHCPIIPVGIIHSGPVIKFAIRHRGCRQTVRVAIGRTRVTVGNPMRFYRSTDKNLSARDATNEVMSEIHRLNER